MASGRSVFKLRTGPLLFLSVACSLAPPPARAQAPDDDWRTLATDHFRVTFPADLESLGRRAAARAEVAYSTYSTLLPEPGGGRIDILLTDHSDESNGYAQVKPYRAMTIFAAPPTDGFQLGFYDDWLELVITHELAHVLHLDYTGTALGRLGRAIFGRAPATWPIFPELATPGWVIEGLATWYESSLTSSGRVEGTYHEMQLRTAILEGRFEGIGQASGRSPIWPGGNRPYLYGSLFFDHLLDRYGQDRMGAFVDAIAGQWVPYRIDAAARAAFGVSFTDAWRAWEDELTRRYADLDRELSVLGPVTEAERITDRARWGLHATVSPDGSRLVYARADGMSDTQLRVAELDGNDDRELTRTNGLATYDWMPDGRLLMSQAENTDPYTAYGDLYVLDRDGHADRLTRGARLSHPSVAPDGSWAVAVQQVEGTNVLVRVELESGAVTRLVAPDVAVHWAFPSFSPGGRWIAVTRWDGGAYQDIVVLDGSGAGEVARLTHDRAVDLAPNWSPDGRWLVWSSDRTGISNVLGAEVDPASGRAGPPRLLTNVRTGVTYPSVDPSGRWLYFSGHHVDGWEVERVPFAPEAASAAPAVATRFDPPAEEPPAVGEASGAVQGYSSIPTLLPRYWEPRYRDPVVAAAVAGGGLDLRRRELLGFGVGAETAGIDLVGRHQYSAYAQVFTSGGKVEGGLSYTFRGLGNPIITLEANQSWASAGRVLTGTAPDTFYVLQRERTVGGAVTVLSTRWRHELAVTAGGALIWSAREQLDNDLDRVPLDASVPPSPRFGEMSLGLVYSTARTHAFQTGDAQGLRLFALGRRRLQLGLSSTQQDVVGTDFSFDEIFGRARAYVPLWRAGHATHVLALQAAGGAAYGPEAQLGHFGVGGASGSPEQLTGFTLFGGSFVPLPVRGYDVSTRFGRWAWSAAGEYRFPLALVNQGAGAWPLHVDRLVGSIFADVGNAWEPNPYRQPLVSVGGEISAQVLAFYDSPSLIRIGIAFPLVDGQGASVYVRAGLSF